MSKKRYNYFDDEPIEEFRYEEDTHNEAESSSATSYEQSVARHTPKHKSVAKRITGVVKSIIIGVLMLFAKLYKAIKKDIEDTAVEAEEYDNRQTVSEFDGLLPTADEVDEPADADNGTPEHIDWQETDEHVDGVEHRSIGPWLRAIIVFTVTILLIVIIIVTAVMNSANKVNSRHSEFEKDATKICTEYAEKYGIANYKYMSEYNVKGYMLTGLCIVREVDFDGNGKSELLLAYNDNDEYYTEVWGYKGNNFEQLYRDKIPQSNNKNDDVWMSIYSSHDLFYIAKHDPANISNVTILKLAGHEFKKKGTAEFNPQDFTFKVKSQDATDSFERIKFSVLRESKASVIVDRTLNSMDMHTEKAEEGNPAKKATASTAYYELVQEYIKRYGEPQLVTNTKMPHINGVAGVNLIDFNGDGTDELMLVYKKTVSQRDEDSEGNYITVESEKYFCDIYTWNGKNAIQVYQDEGIGNLLNDESSAYYILKKDGDRVFYCTNKFKSSDYGRSVTAASRMMRLGDGRFETEFKASYETEYGYTRYYIDDEKTYKNAFTENGGFSIPLFDGEEEYDNTEWQVCFLQGEPKWEVNVKTQYDKTDSTIKTLKSKK